MTTHTTTTKPGPLASTPVFWSMVVAITALTVLLTGWTAAQASAIDDIVDGNGPSHPSVRQLERQGGQDTSQHLSVRQLERVATDAVEQPRHVSIRQAERVAAAAVEQPRHVSIRQAERRDEVRRKRLAQLEAGESRRFANRVAVTSGVDVTVADETRAEPVVFAGLAPEDLARLEHNELRRFRNRAPASALAALDDAIALLRAALA